MPLGMHQNRTKPYTLPFSKLDSLYSCLDTAYDNMINELDINILLDNPIYTPATFSESGNRGQS